MATASSSGWCRPTPTTTRTKRPQPQHRHVRQLVSDARDAEYEHVDPADHDRLFYNKPWWQRVIIMGSGVVINLVIAFFLFAVRVHGVRRLHGHDHRGGGVGVRDRRDRGERRQAAARAARPRIRRRRPRRPASRRATGSSRSTAPRSTAGPRRSARSGPTTTKPGRGRRRAGRHARSPCARPPTVTTRRPTPRTRNGSPRSGSWEWCRPRCASARAWASWSTTMADGTWETMQDDRRDAGEGLPRGARSRRRSRSATRPAR